jgi:co-chaperonin GroES (HSP10)
MKMLANYILVDPEPWTTQKLGSIVLPDNQEARTKFSKGKVLEVGPGLWLHNGDRPKVEVNPNDHVLYFKAGAAPIVVEGKEMHIIQEREVLAILGPGDFGTFEGETNNAAD